MNVNICRYYYYIVVVASIIIFFGNAVLPLLLIAKNTSSVKAEKRPFSYAYYSYRKIYFILIYWIYIKYAIRLLQYV